MAAKDLQQHDEGRSWRQEVVGAAPDPEFQLSSYDRKIRSSKSGLTSVAANFVLPSGSLEITSGPSSVLSVRRPCDPRTSEPSSGITSIRVRNPSLRMSRRLPIASFGDEMPGSTKFQPGSQTGWRGISTVAAKSGART